MAQPTQAQRIERLEAEVAALRVQVNMLLRERQGGLEARAADVRQSIGLRP